MDFPVVAQADDRAEATSSPIMTPAQSFASAMESAGPSSTISSTFPLGNREMEELKEA